MTLELSFAGWRVHRFILEDDGVAMEVKGRRDEIPYAGLSPRSVRVRRSVFWPLVIFLALAVICGAFFYAASFGGNSAAFSMSGILFCLPVLIALREIMKRSRDAILFLERGDSEVAIRLQFFPRDAEAVEKFAMELQRRIETAKTNG